MKQALTVLGVLAAAALIPAYFVKIWGWWVYLGMDRDGGAFVASFLAVLFIMALIAYGVYKGMGRAL